MAGIFTVFGLAVLTTVRSAVVEAAAAKYSADSTVRDEVVKQADGRLQQVNAIVSKAEQLDAKIAATQKNIDTQQTQALVTLDADLQRITRMVEQIESETKQKSKSQ